MGSVCRVRSSGGRTLRHAGGRKRERRALRLSGPLPRDVAPHLRRLERGPAASTDGALRKLSLGLVKHLAYTEDGWFHETIGNNEPVLPYDPNDPDADFRISDEEKSRQIFELYRGACTRSRQVLDAVSLDEMAANPHRRADYNVRWIVVHMIEETARHAGHADIMREQLDGHTGVGYSP